jgi:oligoendopeptidase F
MPMTWDLTDLYAGVDDPALSDALAALEPRAEAFAATNRGRIGALTPEDFAAVLADYEGILHALEFPGAYAMLLFSGESTDPAHGALLQRVQERMVAIQQHLIFFELELIEIPEDAFTALLAHPVTATYRHYLEHARAQRPHRLSEAEERILLEKSTTGRDAFTRLFDEIIAAATFPMTEDDETTPISEAEILAKLHDPRRPVRRAAAAGLTAGLRERSRLFTYITNTLVYDKDVDDRLARYPHPEAARHLADEVDTATVHTMLEACVAHFGTVARYYRLKQSLLGVDRLTHYDLYAPLLSDDALVPWEDARDIVQSAYARFDVSAGQMVRRFFDERWIDAEVRPGKRGGAFCMGLTPDWHPYVLTNYLGRKRDVMTLAHELGHGLHDLLAGGQHLLQYHPSLAAAETASVFGEMLTFHDLVERTASPRERLALLAGKIEDIFATVFRQTALYRFEQALHAARRAEGELREERIDDLWHANLQAMFGDAVELGADYRLWWMYIPHFVHTPFYVYAYAFGQLLTMALYARYQQEGAAFAPHFLNILRAGGSKRPAELMAVAGLDISTRDFWDAGLRTIDNLVTQAEALGAEVGTL